MIKEDLLKSCELTGIWEKKLRDIEHKKYDPAQFVDELKQQITEIVREVLADNSNRHVTVLTDEDLKKKPAAKKTTKKKAAAKSPAPAPPSAPMQTPVVGQPCPLCGQGVIIQGKTAYGCSRWKEGCTYRVPFGQ